MEIQIEKNVPVPQRSKMPKYPLESMEVGDSFLSGVDSDDRGRVQTLRTSICRQQRRLDGRRFSVVKDAKLNEMRVFRVY